MKKIIILIFTFFTLSLNLIAHPPTDLKIYYNLEKSEVYIEVIHPVRSKEDHYIYEIELYLNDKKIITQYSNTQFDNEKQKFIYLIPGLKEEDKLHIYVECNKGGDKKKEIIIKKQEKNIKKNK